MISNETLRGLGDIPYRRIKYFAMSCPHEIREKKWFRLNSSYESPFNSHIITTDENPYQTVIVDGYLWSYSKVTSRSGVIFSPKRSNPLQELWRIHHVDYYSDYGYSLRKLAKKAAMNNIEGRANLKTRNDYIRALMKL